MIMMHSHKYNVIQMLGNILWSGLTFRDVQISFSRHHREYVFRHAVHAVGRRHHPTLVDHGSATYVSGRPIEDDLQ